jgi:hypothetical protein
VEGLAVARAAIWARVSTGDQESQSQLGALQNFAGHRGFDVVEQYVTTASAWNGQYRERLQQALADAYAGSSSRMLTISLLLASNPMLRSVPTGLRAVCEPSQISMGFCRIPSTLAITRLSLTQING